MGYSRLEKDGKMKFLQDWFSAKPEVYIVKVLKQSRVVNTYACYEKTERYTLVEVQSNLTLNGTIPKSVKLELHENLQGRYELTRNVGEVYELADPLKRGWKVAP